MMKCDKYRENKKKNFFQIVAFAFLFFLFPFFIYSQVKPDSIGLSDDVLEKVIEDAMTNLEGEDQADWSTMTDLLSDLARKPLDLNTASEEDLMLLPGFTPILAENLAQYIEKFGALTSVYELEAVPGFNAEIFGKIKPYVTVRASSKKDLTANTLHPAGPSFKTVLTGSHHEILTRVLSVIEEQKGFTPPDTNSDGSLTSRYEGSSPRVYFRYRMKYGQNFSFNVLGEKDSGEPFRWDPEKKTYGFDFTSAHIALQDYGHLKRLVIGDYNIQVGQGLALSTGLGFGKGGDVIMSIKKQAYGLRPYASVNENQYLRGAAATVAFGHFYFTGFVSRLGLDANVVANDTIFNDNADGLQVSTLQTGGYHRTPSEIADKASLLETMIGGRAEYKSRRLTVGTTNFLQTFGSTIQPSSSDYQHFYFSGRQNYLNTIDFDWTRRNFDIFGEVARSASGGLGISTGVIGSIDPKVDVSIYFRSFDPDFHSTRGFAFAESPTSLSNEKGIYFGLKVRPIPKWTLSAFMDEYWFPWNRYQVSFPSHGFEYLTQLQYTPNKVLNVYLRWRSDNKQYNASDVDPSQKIEYLVPQSSNHLRLHFEYKVSRTLSVESRIERSWFTRADSTEKGLLLYQDISWKLAWKWKITGRYAIFDAPQWNARIYAYENDVPGFYNIPAYTGTGSRYYLILQFSPTKGLSFWARYSRTTYPNDKVISSGLSEIQGNTRSEFKLQMKLEF